MSKSLFVPKCKHTFTCSLCQTCQENLLAATLKYLVVGVLLHPCNHFEGIIVTCSKYICCIFRPAFGVCKRWSKYTTCMVTTCKISVTIYISLHVTILLSLSFLSLNKCTMIRFDFLHSLLWNLTLFLSIDVSKKKQINYKKY